MDTNYYQSSNFKVFNHKFELPLNYSNDKILYKFYWSHGSFELFNVRLLEKNNLTGFFIDY